MHRRQHARNKRSKDVSARVQKQELVRWRAKAGACAIAGAKQGMRGRRAARIGGQSAQGSAQTKECWCRGTQA
eukprot:292504-Pleurochrysis_carterae.AAC.2